MKSFFKEYGGTIIASLVVVCLIAVCTVIKPLAAESHVSIVDKLSNYVEETLDNASQNDLNSVLASQTSEIVFRTFDIYVVEGEGWTLDVPMYSESTSEQIVAHLACETYGGPEHARGKLPVSNNVINIEGFELKDTSTGCEQLTLPYIDVYPTADPDESEGVYVNFVRILTDDAVVNLGIIY